jgi:competence protein ComEC
LIQFKNIPFVRILIPFVFGIFICTANHLNFKVIFPLIGSLIILVLLYFKTRKTTLENGRWAYIAVSDVFLFLCGLYCCYACDIKNTSGYYGHYITTGQHQWVGEVKELPVEKEKFYKVVMGVRALQDQPQLQGKAIIYFKKPINVALLSPGNILNLKSEFNTIREPLNPHEFNYKEFLARKSIYYQSFVSAGNGNFVSENHNFSLIYFGLKIKQKIISVFKASNLNPEAAQLCIALLTGYDDEINSETINAFAHSGTLHVLSVSGLHIGILYAVLVFVLGLFDKKKKHKLLHLIVISIALWFFVLITGFSPPVLRAVIMLNLIAVGRFYYGYSSQHSINILAVSAFILLVFDPLLIYDTGFLLSYSAVLGILCFEPGFTALVESKYTIVNKTWQLISVSLSAQITTLPITLFLFHQFPLWFIFSNLLVIPLCTAVMFLGFLILIKFSFISPLINLCSSLIFYCIHLTDKEGIGYIDRIDFGFSDLVFLAAFITTAALFIKHRSYAFVTAASLLFILWQTVSLFEVTAKKSLTHIGIYQVNKQTAIDLKNAEQVLFCKDLKVNDYNFHVKNNHSFYNYPQIDDLNYDYVRSKNISLLRISEPDHQSLIEFLKPDYLLITNNVDLNETSIKESGVKLLIADGSNNYKVIKKLRLLCDKFDIAFYSTAEKGYLQINI